MTEAERDAAIMHMNADHGDAVLLYAQVFGELPDAQRATMTGLDEDAMGLSVQTSSGSRNVTIPLASPAATLDAARAVLVDMAREARARRAASG